MRFLLGELTMSVSSREEVSVTSDLEQLLKLQEIDYDIGELERSKEYLPDMMENLRTEMTEAENNLETAKEAITEAKVAQNNLETDLADRESKLQKYQQQMMSIKTNKEYDALVAEIDSLKEEISQKETQLLETIDKIKVLEEKIGEYTEKAGQVKENNSKQLGILQEKVDSIGDKMNEKQVLRKEIKDAISKRTLSVYERVRRGKGGAVIAPVKRRACGACYSALTPKKVQEIRRADFILTCDNCGRMLYWNGDESN
jgi:predicted  nucleic acid-binding Zn-ribbon protein